MAQVGTHGLLLRIVGLIRHLLPLRRGVRRSSTGIETRARKGEIHLADLIVALDQLPWESEAHTRAIAGCLGFGLGAPNLQPSKPATAIYDRGQRARKAPAVTAAPPRPALRAPPAPPIPIALPSKILQSTLTDLAPAPTPEESDPPWLASGYEVLRAEDRLPPPRQTLLPANRARGVLSAALAVLREGDELDVGQLIDRVVVGRLPSRLPRRPDATLSLGCQLLLDFGDTMTPWWEDLHALSSQVAAVVGEAAVSTFDFEAIPAAASRWQGDEKRGAWQPLPGTPVLVASDLGIRGRAAPRQVALAWQAFVARCEAAGSPLVILIPWPREYWPEGLGRHPDLVHWNPRTTAAMVRQEIGPGHRARR